MKSASSLMCALLLYAGMPAAPAASDTLNMSSGIHLIAGVGDPDSDNPNDSQNDSNRPLNSVGNLGPTLGDSDWAKSESFKVKCRNADYRQQHKTLCAKYPAQTPQDGS